ncbi:MAG: hypothetical protein H0T52_12585 [Lautropia sp.]|nr:hypothetical protein [Lautropia sp.]
MIRENHTAVVARNERWSGVAATEPYEAGWATEAVIFVRALGIERAADAAEATDGDDDASLPDVRVQMSADGMRWIDEGSSFPLPETTERDTCARVAHFGNWLRIVAQLPPGVAMKVLVTVHLK